MQTDHIASLLSSGEYSDLTIECQGRFFKVHRAIVCSQSPVIDAALREKPKALQNIIKIDDFDSDTVERMIEFMYGIKSPFSNAADVRSAQKAALEANTLPLENGKPNFMDIFGPVLEADKKDMVARVNASRIADHYHVPAMAKFVHDEMNRIFQTDWQEGIFVEALKFTLASKASSDLLCVFAKAASEHIEDICCYDGVAEWMANRGFAVQLVNASAKRAEELTNALKTQVDLANSQAERLISAKKVHEHMEQCLNKLYDTESCRHCKADFCGHIATNDHKNYTIRCSKCRTRH